jgi:hypothetical protein
MNSKFTHSKSRRKKIQNSTLKIHFESTILNWSKAACPHLMSLILNFELVILNWSEAT